MDDETGYYYYGARYYNPRTSIWLGTDALAGYDPIMNDEHYIDGEHNGGVYNSFNNNPYIYCYQKPIILVDPNGKQAWAQGILGWIGSDIAVPEPTDAAWPKWAVYAVGAAVAGTAIYLHETTKPIAVPRTKAIDIPQEKSKPRKTVNFYRQMSQDEYAQTGGLLMDTNKSGEARGGHVRKDIAYIENAKFLKKKAATDVLVKYTVDAEVAAAFDLTPFQTTANNEPGKNPTYDNARKAGVWYKKREGKNDKGATYGFPGKATVFFNSGLVKTPEVVKK